MLYFIFFALIILIVIWCLQDFFINNYYESMRYSESLRTANSLESEYRENPRRFGEYANESGRASCRERV